MANERGLDNPSFQSDRQVVGGQHQNAEPSILEQTPELAKTYQQTVKNAHPPSRKPNTNRGGYFCLQLFRYATTSDILLMLLGVGCAVFQGIAIPVAFAYFANRFDPVITFQSCWNDVRDAVREAKATNSSLPTSFLSNLSVEIPDSVLDDEPLFDNMWPHCIYLSLLGMGIFIAGIIHASAWTIAGERQLFRIRIDLFRAILRKDVAWFGKHQSGELNNILFHTVRKLEDGLSSKVPNTLSWSAMSVTGFCLAFAASWKVSLVACSLVPVVLAISYVTIRVIRIYTIKQSTAYDSAGSVANEILNNWRTVVAFNKQDFEVDRYYKLLADSMRLGIVKTIVAGFGHGVKYIVLYTMTSISFWFGSRLALTGGNLMRIANCIYLGGTSLGNASPNFASFASAMGAVDQVFALIDEEPTIDNFGEFGKKPKTISGEIRIEALSFSYPSRPQEMAIRTLSLHIPSGKTVALVGASGCGKSTLVQLLMRFYNPSEGRITLDDVDIREFNLRWYRHQIGIVNQEPVLFNMSIRENVRLGAGHKVFISDDDIVRVCKMANADEFISKLPLGYETHVGDRGAQLSGGQKQRIAIARALVSDPRILILDEATSALDTSSESVVQDALDKASVGRTTLVIAHRLSTVRNADLIAVVDKGMIVEIGTHDELLKRENGFYYRSVISQQNTSQDEHELPPISVKSQQSEPGSKLAPITDSISPELENVDEQVKRHGHFCLFRTVLRWNKPELGLIIGCIIASIILGANSPGHEILMSEFIGLFCPKIDASSFDTILGLVIGIGTFECIFITIQSLFYSGIGERLTARLRRQVLAKMLRMDAQWHDNPQNQPGVLTTILAADCSDVQGLSGIRLGMLSTVGVVTGVCAIYGLVLEYRIALAMFPLLPLVVFAGVAYTRVFIDASKEDEQASRDSMAIAMDAIGNMRTVISLAAEPFFLDRFSRRYQKLQRRKFINGILASPLLSFAFVSILWQTAIALAIGSYLLERHETSLLYLIRTYFLLGYCGFTIGRHVAPCPDEEKACQGAVKIMKIFEASSSIDVEQQPQPVGNIQLAPERLHLVAPRCFGRVDFKQVAFSYPNRPGVEVLKDVSFTVHPGQFVAICGASGGGKSTLMQLLQRFYDPTAGQILLDGVDIRSVSVHWLRSNIGVVSQEPVLFATSILDNVAYGLPTNDAFDMRLVENVCQQANAIDFIRKFPVGFNTQVGERGAQLSGGQKQRIAIARALIRNPNILLFDEATSALDAESEQVVQEAMDAARLGRTCLVIAHLLSTIRNADKIVVLDHGKVVEEGTNAELMRLKGTYYRLAQRLAKTHQQHGSNL